jgi:hypothetical protein
MGVIISLIIIINQLIQQYNHFILKMFDQDTEKVLPLDHQTLHQCLKSNGLDAIDLSDFISSTSTGPTARIQPQCH